MRKRGGDGEWTALSAADPLNLTGIVTPGPRVRSAGGNRLLLRDGVTLATPIRRGEVQFHQRIVRRTSSGRQVRNALRRATQKPGLARLAKG